MNEQEQYERFRWRMMRIERTHQERMNKIKRDGARMRLFMCPPVALLFGVLAYYNAHTGVILLAVFYGLDALAFVGMLIGGAIFDKPIDLD